MSRVLAPPSRRDPHVHGPAVRRWVTHDLVVVDRPLTSSGPTFVTVTGHATIHTKGNYSDLVASTAANVTMVRIRLNNTTSNGVATSNLVDIAVGSAGNEVVVAANLNAAYLTTSTQAAATYWLPLAIPAGSRISARSQGLVSADTVDVNITTFAGSNHTATAIDTIGADTATSKGVNVAAGTTGSEGSWTQITASTSNIYTGVLWGVGGAADTSWQDTNILMDLGTGAAASEVAFLSDLQIIGTSAEVVQTETSLPVYSTYIPAGTRIAARMQESSGTAQSADVILYCLR